MAWAFFDCGRLEETTLPESIDAMGDVAFAGCSFVASFVFPKNFSYVPNCMFINCAVLRKVEPAEDTNHIGHPAFGFCTSLQSVVMPEKLGFVWRSLRSLCRLPVP